MSKLLITVAAFFLAVGTLGCSLLDSPECKMAKEQLADANLKGGSKEWNEAALLEPKANVSRWCK